MITEDEQKSKADDEKQQARLQIHATVKEVIPGPDVLGPGHRNELDGSEQQQKAA